MGATAQQADEYSPSRDIDFDPTADHVIGKRAGVTEGPMDGESAAVLPTHFLGRGVDIVRAFMTASAPAAFYLEHQTHPKYADDLIGLLGGVVEPGPVPGAEASIGLLNEQATQQYNTKEPKMRSSDQPNAATVQANLAASPGDLLPSSESAMMSLLFDF